MYATYTTADGNHYVTNTGKGDPGDAGSPWGIAVLFTHQGTVAWDRYLSAKTGSSVEGGWSLVIMNGSMLLQFRWYSSSGGSGSAIVANSVSTGVVHLAVVTFDPNGNLVTYYDNASVTTKATSGLRPCTNKVETLLTTTLSSRAATNFQVVAKTSFRGAPSAAQIGQLYAAAKTANDLPTSMSGATLYSRYSVRDSGGLGTTNLINSVNPSDNLLRVGSPSLIQLPNPAYGW